MVFIWALLVEKCVAGNLVRVPPRCFLPQTQEHSVSPLNKTLKNIYIGHDYHRN